MVLLQAEARAQQKAADNVRALLETALNILGGSERLAQLDDWLVEGKGRENLSAELQGLSAEAPTWRPHRESVAVKRSGGLAVAWERRTPRNDHSLRWRRFIYKADSFGVVDFVSGNAGRSPGGTSEETRIALMRRIPHLLLLDVSTNARGLRVRGDQLLEAEMPDMALLLRFAKNPPVLEQLEDAIYMPGLGDSHIRWRWHGWWRDRLLGYRPSGHVLTINGKVFQEVSYTTYMSGKPEAKTLLEVPAHVDAMAGFSHSSPPVGGPAEGEVAPGVHVAEEGGFMVMFVEFHDFVVAFDAPAAAPGLESIPSSNRTQPEAVSARLRDRIAKTCPNKPVRYIVLSHHHSDHLGGGRLLAGDGTTVLAAAGDVGAVRRALVAPRTFAPGGALPTKSEVKVTGVRDRYLITDGSRPMEIINVGKNPHTRENLFAWLPQERIVLQGDLFYYEEGAPFPPSGRQTMNRFFAHWLAAHGFKPKAIYGVHYRGAAGQEALAIASRRK